MVKQTNSNKDYNTAEFMFDSADELSSLPTDCGMGSTALCIGSGQVYVLSSDKEWKAI